jgi:hypothetical protein
VVPWDADDDYICFHASRSRHFILNPRFSALEFYLNGSILLFSFISSLDIIQEKPS